ncbi:DUF533 domain-containing protein [Pseudohalioglobus lutimaris]|uniref:DUF533 domain-containing protein n=2 Tax=Pseudohalioglobus lutimaris TaxID=1737061 RepID=A0A2N5X950_9GAMM|nr:DUF533 domain-containing protein [Pseudohalioglobus lutimaris]
MGGAAAGGVVALLLGSKKARKFAGKAAGYGGAAVVGGLAYRALQNWRQAPQQTRPQVAAEADPQWAAPPASTDNRFAMKLVTAMIAAAKADGHIDGAEQERIFAAVEQMQLSSNLKALVLDMLRQPISVTDVAQGVEGLEQKAELYTASCLAIDEDDPRERAYLDQLALALNLPTGLSEQIRLQAQQDVIEPEQSGPGNMTRLTG